MRKNNQQKVMRRGKSNVFIYLVMVLSIIILGFLIGYRGFRQNLVNRAEMEENKTLTEGELLDLAYQDPSSFFEEINNHPNPNIIPVKNIKGILQANIADSFTDSTSKTSYAIDVSSQTNELVNSKYNLIFKTDPYLKDGDGVTLSGFKLKNTLMVDNGNPSSFEAIPQQINTKKDLTVGVVRFNFQNGDKSQNADKNIILSAFRDTNGVIKYFEENSFGKLNIIINDNDIMDWVTIDQTGNEKTNDENRECAFERWADMAEEKINNNKFPRFPWDKDLKEQYDILVFLFPYQDACWINLPGRPKSNWQGRGIIGGKRIWLNGVFGQTEFEHFAAGALSHEFGHILGLTHANGLTCVDQKKINYQKLIGENCQNWEFGDPFDVMGDFKRYGQLNAYSKEKLNWLGNKKEMIEIKPGYKYEVQLTTIEKDPSTSPYSSLVKINIPNSDYYYSLEYRQPKGFDGFLPINSAGDQGFILIRMINKNENTMSYPTYLINSRNISNGDFSNAYLLKSSKPFYDEKNNIEITETGSFKDYANIEIRKR